MNSLVLSSQTCSLMYQLKHYLNVNVTSVENNQVKICAEGTIDNLINKKKFDFPCLNL